MELLWSLRLSPIIAQFSKKYVDDISTGIHEGGNGEMSHIFNAYSLHIQFIVEKESNITFHFLVTDNNTSITDWYIKPTSSGRNSNYNFFHSIKVKIYLVLG